MEGILIWIVVVVIWAVIKGVFSSGGSGKYQDEAGDDIDAFAISVKHQIPDKAYKKREI